MVDNFKRYANPACAALLLSMAARMPVQAAEGPARAAWIDGASAPTAALVRIQRAGKDVTYQAAVGLLACDQLQLLDAKKVVRIVLADGARVRLDASQPLAKIACDSNTIGTTLGRLLSAWNSQSDTRDTAAGVLSRDEGPLELPILFAPSGAVMAQADQLYLTWRGGKGPFTMALRDAGGANVAERARIATHATVLALPLPRMVPGKYALQLSDSSNENSSLTEENMVIVEGSTIPSMPTELREAELDPTARQLFYADFLVAYEDGRYAMQALQLVAALKPQTAASRSWLASWGSGE
jgi:hypothetical protein